MKKAEPLIRDCYLEPASTSTMGIRLIIDFIKFLCFQKTQIPVTCTQLESQLRAVIHELGEKPDLSLMKSREKMAYMKQRRSKETFVKRGDSFLLNLKEICRCVDNRFVASQQQVAVILGTSIFNPKETYVLDFTHWKDSPNSGDFEETRNLKRNLSNFFRDLVISEDLFAMLQPILPTYVSVLFQHEASAHSDPDWLPRLNFRLPTRGKQMILRILPKPQIDAPLAIRPQARCHRSAKESKASRVLQFGSPAPEAAMASRRWGCPASDLNISGVTLLEDEAPSGGLCWFQLRSVLHGFTSHI